MSEKPKGLSQREVAIVIARLSQVASILGEAIGSRDEKELVVCRREGLQSVIQVIREAAERLLDLIPPDQQVTTTVEAQSHE